MVPDFVHSLAAYLARAPQLQAYRDLLTQVRKEINMVQNKNNKERKKEIALLLVDKLRLPMFCN
jgi:hypothetical protein